MLGIQTFTNYGLATNKGELLFYSVSPTNISVLSHANIEIKIRHLMMLLSSIPDVEISCTDSSECFDDNKAYLKDRLEQENNVKVRSLFRSLLQKDVVFLDRIQSEMATARQFLFIIRTKSKKTEQTFQITNRAEKIVTERGFEVKRMGKEEIKRFLAIYFDASYNGEQMPDYDHQTLSIARNSTSAPNLNMVNTSTLLLTVCRMTVITKDIVEKPSVWEIGSVRQKVCLIESQMAFITAKVTGRMSAVLNIHTLLLA